VDWRGSKEPCNTDDMTTHDPPPQKVPRGNGAGARFPQGTFCGGIMPGHAQTCQWSIFSTLIAGGSSDSVTGFQSVATYCYSAPTGKRSIVLSVSVCLSVGLSVCVCVCLSTIISSELHIRSSPKFLCMLPMTVDRSSFSGVVIRYVLPVL